MFQLSSFQGSRLEGSVVQLLSLTVLVNNSLMQMSRRKGRHTSLSVKCFSFLPSRPVRRRRDRERGIDRCLHLHVLVSTVYVSNLDTLTEKKSPNQWSVLMLVKEYTAITAHQVSLFPSSWLEWSLHSCTCAVRLVVNVYTCTWDTGLWRKVMDVSWVMAFPPLVSYATFHNLTWHGGGVSYIHVHVNTQTTRQCRSSCLDSM